MTASSMGRDYPSPWAADSVELIAVPPALITWVVFLSLPTNEVTSATLMSPARKMVPQRATPVS